MKRKRTIEWLIKNYMPFYLKFGMNEENIIQYHKSWKENRPDIIEDYAWFIFNYLLNENAKQSSSDVIGLFERYDIIYREMIAFRRKIEGKKANEIQKIYNRNQVELQIEKNSDNLIEYNFTIITPNDCNSCKHITDKIISKKQALENDIIPYFNCERKVGCVCLVCPIPKRDENGRLKYID